MKKRQFECYFFRKFTVTSTVISNVSESGKTKFPINPLLVMSFVRKTKYFFDHVSHVVIRTIPSVPNKNSSLIRVSDMSVYKLAKSKEFIFFMCRLKNGIRIDPLIYVIKGIDVHAVKAGGRMSLR